MTTATSISSNEKQPRVNSGPHKRAAGPGPLANYSELDLLKRENASRKSKTWILVLSGSKRVQGKSKNRNCPHQNRKDFLQLNEDGGNSTKNRSQ